MAQSITYDTLVQDIQNYLERDDTHLVEEIPTFILLGQRRLARDLKILGYKASLTGVMEPGHYIIDKPAQWLNDSSFMMGINLPDQTDYQTRIPILQRDYDYCVMYWPNRTLMAQPKYYTARYQWNWWYLAPTPDQAYPFEILYYQIPDLLGPEEQMNWASLNVPDALLYACLVETAPYLKDDERVPIWKDYYQTAISAITQEDKQRILDGFSVQGG